MQTKKAIQEILEIFSQLICIPHGSGNTKDMAMFLVNFVKEHGYCMEQDDNGNLFCMKPNETPKICFQSHYDMVCVGRAAKQLPLEIVNNKRLCNGYEQTWLSALDSSLGADNGIGVAIMLYFIKQQVNAEFLFTNDEEIGMVGAKALNIPIQSKILINLDSEVLGEITIGCAGGYDATYMKDFMITQIPSNWYYYSLQSQNFAGGHSGIDINKSDFKHQNAILESAKFLHILLQENKVNEPAFVLSWHGGEKRNSIPIHSQLIFACKQELTIHSNDFFTVVELQDKIAQENNFSSSKILSESTGIKFDILQNCLMRLPIGVIALQDNVVQNSLNLSCISFESGSLKLDFMGRANTNDLLQANLQNLKNQLLQTLDYNASYKESNFCVGEYYAPWEKQTKFSSAQLHDFCKKPVLSFNTDKYVFENILHIMYQSMDLHTQALQIKPEIVELHAGLECGILLSRFEELGLQDIIALSIGPTIHSPHSVHEEVWLESVGVIVAILQDFMTKIYAK